jgi:hypothetical protein
VNGVLVVDDGYRPGASAYVGGMPSSDGHGPSCSPDCGHDHGLIAARSAGGAVRQSVPGSTPLSVVGVRAGATRKV